jgi:hypothetical protein
VGHYASEMDPDWGTYIEESEERRNAGFRRPHMESLNHPPLECSKCSAVVMDWRKHRDWHDQEGK